MLPSRRLLTELLKERDDELRVEAADHDDEQLQQPDEPPAASDLPAGGPDLYECIKRDSAASRIQQAWRLKALGHDSAKLVHTLQIDEGAALEAPSHEVAKRTYEERCCRTTMMASYSPMSEGLAAFDEFGVEVAGYIRDEFLTYTGRVFWAALLLNLFGILNNLDGGHAEDLLAKHSLNNADCLSNAYGWIEALTNTLFVGFAYWMRNELNHIARRIQEEEDDGELLTAANFSIIATNCRADNTRVLCGQIRSLLPTSSQHVRECTTGLLALSSCRRRKTRIRRVCLFGRDAAARRSQLLFGGVGGGLFGQPAGAA